MCEFKKTEKNVATVIRKMNAYGRKGIPFLFIIDFLRQKPVVYKLDEVDTQEVLFEIDGVRNFYPMTPLVDKEIVFEKFPLSLENYKKGFDLVLKGINKGDSFLLNYSAPTPIQTNLTLREIFYQSTAKYKLLYKDQFVCFSPEIFVKIIDGKISSYPMKGTIDASLPDASALILADKKEFAEHATIVDLIRNDLSKVAQKVRVEKFRYIEELKTNQKNLLQVSSKIVGEMPVGYEKSIGDILWELLPAGSISGAPKKRTLEIIAEAENYDRGYYTGIFGCFDGKNLDSGVMIRFIEKINGQLFFKSGGGITAQSDLHTEYEELIHKVYVPIIRND